MSSMSALRGQLSVAATTLPIAITEELVEEELAKFLPYCAKKGLVVRSETYGALVYELDEWLLSGELDEEEFARVRHMQEFIGRIVRGVAKAAGKVVKHARNLKFGAKLKVAQIKKAGRDLKAGAKAAYQQGKHA